MVPCDFLGGEAGVQTSTRPLNPPVHAQAQQYIANI